MKILVAIPIIKNAVVAKEAIEQVINKEGVHVILLDNGADQDVKELINSYENNPSVSIQRNAENVYVNPAWNQFMSLFLESEYERLIILNSDLTLHKDWDLIVRNIWNRFPDFVLTPVVSNDKTQMFEPIGLEPLYFTSVDNPAGIFITLNKQQCKQIYPIPSEIKVWFGDTALYAVLRAYGYDVVVPYNLLAYHHTSTSVSSVKGVSEVIEQDKKAWDEIVQPMLVRQIESIKSKLN